MDEDLVKALDALDDAEREMGEGAYWSERGPDDWFYTVACQLAYLWRDMKKGEPEPKPGRFITGLTFGISPLDGKPYIVRMESDGPED